MEKEQNESGRPSFFRTKTLFWHDFDIAEKNGVDAIKKAYKNAFEASVDHYEYLTELAIILKWKMYQYDMKNESLAKVYYELWKETDEFANKKLRRWGLNYYWKETELEYTRMCFDPTEEINTWKRK